MVRMKYEYDVSGERREWEDERTQEEGEKRERECREGIKVRESENECYKVRVLV